MRLTWTTDIHLDFITNPQDSTISIHNMDIFCDLLLNERPDAVLITGDVSLSNFLVEHLNAMESRLQVPIYFVLGNHDFWGSDTETVRKKTIIASNASEYLRYLSAIPYVVLNDETVLIGHDGWYDGFNGEPKFSNLVMNDWTLIGDYVRANVITNRKSINFDSLLMIARKQALIAANHVANGIKSALSQKSPATIIVATHVPPFIEPLKGINDSPNEFYPWYSSKLMGDVLMQAANNNRHVQFEIFCGHCHKSYEGNILPNLTLRSGASEYADPRPQKTFSV